MPGAKPVSHTLVAEVPVAMVFDGTSAAVMMASPTDIEDFAIGFARTEGFINNLSEVESFEVVTQQTSKGMTAIEARFWLAPERSEAVAARRRSMAGPIGCGLCGIESIEETTRQVPTLPPGELPMTYDEINQATEQLRAHQPLHDQARAVHGAGFLQPGKGIIAAREDVGRHNALDKLLGALIRQGINPASGAIVMTSRLSVELVQKAAIAGCPAIIAVSAPTAYAVEVANKANITLAALSRGDGFTMFTHGERLGHLNT
ncbi:MAG: formate dehydrogenase accessory sulfurtransferase FdhD [Alphaproteobacteria bacterium]|nr:formate dehydrogenase accessory sulfurtransferase FdhD [Alphaproteobacteria bacterium SS10]